LRRTPWPLQTSSSATTPRPTASRRRSTAIAEYRLEDGVINFFHTEVPPAFEGRGIGGALVRAGLAAARERGLKVQPDCPFFAAYFQRHPEAHDLLTDEARAKLTA
jgi:predicted GNAT family acetyltransferase